MITLEYDFTLEDVVAFADHHASHAPYVVSRTRRMRWIWAALFACLALVSLWASTPYTVLCGALAVVSFATYPYRVRLSYRRHNRGLYRTARSSLFGRLEAQLDGEGLRARSEGGESLYRHTAIDRVEHGPEHIFVYVGPTFAVTIPKKRILSGDLNAFVTELERLHPTPAA